MNTLTLTLTAETPTQLTQLLKDELSQRGEVQSEQMSELDKLDLIAYRKCMQVFKYKKQDAYITISDLMKAFQSFPQNQDVSFRTNAVQIKDGGNTKNATVYNVGITQR